MLNQHPILFWYTCVCRTQYEFIEFKSALYFELNSMSNVALYFICRSNSINQSELCTVSKEIGTRRCVNAG